MSDSRASLEVIAPSVEEAVAKGLSDLGMPEAAVDIEVLDAGSKGLFGLGARQARVRLRIKEQPKKSAEQAAPARREAPPSPPSAAPAAEPAVEKPAAPKPAAPEAAAAEPAREKPRVEDTTVEEVLDEVPLQVARETVTDLLERMKVQASVTSYYGEVADERSRPPVVVDIRGKDLSILIGPRAETLNALQYITSLIVSKELGSSVPLIVDVEGYRGRREKQLRQLARRMADQAVKTGRRQVLEPMPANERRLIHIELRGNPDVSTQSTGEEPRRKVTVIPEK